MKNCVRCAWLALGLLSLNHVEYSLSAQMFDNPIEAKLWYFVRGEGGSPSPSVAEGFRLPLSLLSIHRQLRHNGEGRGLDQNSQSGRRILL